MKRLFFILTVISVLFYLNSPVYAIAEQSNKTEITEVHQQNENSANKSEVEKKETEKSESEGGMEPLFFVIIALLLGAATKHFLRKSPIPFTVMLLLIGLGIGVVSRLGYFTGNFHTLDVALSWAGKISPEIILFIFLPTLVFEGAFGLDVHVFKKSVTNATLLAAPGLIIAMIITAGFVILCKVFNLGLENWTWGIALMFGAVVSATDPVAVVAILKELGVSKKLATLIDGESMLNDGTSIVVFMVFFLGITGVVSDNPAVVEFLRVAIGGTLVGLVIAWAATKWIKNVFNNAMVEISVIVACAYLTFFTAEHFFHVSGVLGLVAYGLYMSGNGKTKISPEVNHFLHEFWELAAFIANTIIFIIVGVVIAHQAVFTSKDFITLGIIYVGVHVARAVMILILYPIIKQIGYGIQWKENYILWWGGLRGAIALALALVVSSVDDKYIAADIRNQFVFLTAGLVVLTLLINATTMKWLIKKLGFAEIPIEKILMVQSAKRYIRESSEKVVERLQNDKHIHQANWKLVENHLTSVDEISFSNVKIDTLSEIRRRLLEKEKSSYWHQFNEGMLGPLAVRKLTEGISMELDNEGHKSLSSRKDMEDMLHMPVLLLKLHKVPVLSWFVNRSFQNKLMMSFDCAKGFVEAQDEVTKLFDEICYNIKSEDDKKVIPIIENEINENKILRGTFLRNLKKMHPEIYNSLSTKHSIRTILNHEKKTIINLLHSGRLEENEASVLISDVEEKIKKVMMTSLNKF